MAYEDQDVLYLHDREAERKSSTFLMICKSHQQAAICILTNMLSRTVLPPSLKVSPSQNYPKFGLLNSTTDLYYAELNGPNPTLLFANNPVSNTDLIHGNIPHTTLVEIHRAKD